MVQPAYPRLPLLPDVQPPMAEAKPHIVSHHNLELSDDYFWLRGPEYPTVKDPSILRYLNQENDYFRTFIETRKDLVDTLFEEFKGRENDQDASVPWVEHGFEYRWYFDSGAEYRTWVRKSLSGNDEEIILNEAVEAAKHDYFDVESVEVSPNGRYMAWTVDTNGSERFTVFIQDLTTGTTLPDQIECTSGEVVWSANSDTLIYTVVSEEWRPYLIKAHVLGTPVADDVQLYEEHDTGFFLEARLSQSEEFIIISTGSMVVSEVYVIPANTPTAKPKLMVSRDEKILYEVDHADGYFYIRTNDKHVNFRIAKTPDSQLSYEHWQTIWEGSDTRYLTDMLTLENALVVAERENGLDQIRVFDQTGTSTTIDFPDDAYSVYLDNNSQPRQGFIRLKYLSMVTPDTVYDYDLKSATLQTRKVKEIPSGYDASLYETKRLMAPARDGARIPVSIVYKKGHRIDGTQPLHLYGYGAYGSGMPVALSSINLSLVNRGFAFAIAHVRGGDEMGYQWYLDGKLDKRQNAFNDFVDVADFLIAKKFTGAGNISISGASAGGELMGAVVNQRPELWRSVILGVPFVDVLNTMLDGDLPLTPGEWPEWGNPVESKADFETIQAYSPYDHIEPKEYPPMLVTGGLNDPRVTYWEPAKWTAKMRALKTDNNLLVMRMHMGAGHFASSGRYERLKDYAEEFAFMLTAHNME